MAADIGVTGCGGFIGRHLVGHLTGNGLRVRGISRHQIGDVSNAPVHVVSSYTAESEMTRAFDGLDSIVHLAGRAHVTKAENGSQAEGEFRRANHDAAVSVARAARAAGCRRLVLVSSIGVNGNRTHGKPFTEGDPPAPQELYAQSKLQAELSIRALLSSGPMDWVVVRPPLIYGPHCPGNFRSLIKIVQRLPWLPFGGLSNRRSLMGVDNLCSALQEAIFHPACKDSLFLLSDGQDIEVSGIVRCIAQGLGRSQNLHLSLPAGTLKLAARVVGRAASFEKLAGELLVDSRHFSASTGWKAPVPVDRGIQLAAASFSASPNGS